MNRRHFIASLATGALAAPLLADNLTVSLPKTSAKTSAKTPVVDFDVLLWAIAEKETGNDDTKVGPCGSRSKYQISEAVWRQHGMHKKAWEPVSHTSSMKPYALRFDADCWGWLAKDLAQHHLRWLDRHLRDTYAWSTYASVYTLAFAWHVGLESFLRYRGADPDSPAARRALGHGYPYANAVSNLYFDRLHSCSATS